MGLALWNLLSQQAVYEDRSREQTFWLVRGEQYYEAIAKYPIVYSNSSIKRTILYSGRSNGSKFGL